MEGKRREQGQVPVRREGGGWIDPWGRFSEEIDRMFDELWHPSFLRRGRMTRMWSPQIDVLQRDGNLVVRADLPGIKRDNLEVEITQNMLTLRGERRQEEEEQEEGVYRSERVYGSFVRTIPLPEGVDSSQVKASFQDGVLEIRIPLPQRAEQTRRIQIEEGARGRETSRSEAGTQAGGGSQGRAGRTETATQAGGGTQGRTGTGAGQQAASRAGRREPEESDKE
jgi:HSP20 family protein